MNLRICLYDLEYESKNRFYKVMYKFGGDKMKLWENYKWSIILLISVIIGGIVGLIIGPRAEVVEPLGNLFLNLMFTAIVPLVFF